MIEAVPPKLVAPMSNEFTEVVITLPELGALELALLAPIGVPSKGELVLIPEYSSNLTVTPGGVAPDQVMVRVLAPAPAAAMLGEYQISWDLPTPAALPLKAVAIHCQVEVGLPLPPVMPVV